MAFMTDRKRANGMGSAKEGTHHFWSMTVSSIALAILMPLFIFNFGPMLDESYADVQAHFARPYPAILTGLTLIVAFTHFKMGAQTMIEDYVKGGARKITIIAVSLLSYAAMATGLFALASIAL
ncbi:MAG: succinate dehydrogenase, hydrophobic membrane anchor protein [Paracoccaceae bacterium]|nr:succinate dehydrogenase, hydrophobic membrane anchor protein [Rhodobacteraceae bacterium HTCC2150]MDG1531394.1 succinate dehydrogenase, hydrophobic membrane anchor protein [Paracoccaceae bacterium]